MEEVGQLYESQGEFGTALDHYARNCRVFSAAATADYHPVEAHTKYQDSLFAARAAVHQICKFRPDCKVENGTSNDPVPISGQPGRPIEFDPECEVVLPAKEEKRLVAETLRDNALRERIDPEKVEIAMESDDPRQELIQLTLGHAFSQGQKTDMQMEDLRARLHAMRPSRWSAAKRGTMFTFDGGKWNASAISSDDGTSKALEIHNKQLQEEQDLLKRQVESLSEMLAVTNIERQKMADILATRDEVTRQAERSADLVRTITFVQNAVESGDPTLFWDRREEIGAKDLGVVAARMHVHTLYYADGGIEATTRWVDGVQRVDLVQTGYPLHVFTATVPDPLDLPVAASEDGLSTVAFDEPEESQLRWWEEDGLQQKRRQAANPRGGLYARRAWD